MPEYPTSYYGINPKVFRHKAPEGAAHSPEQDPCEDHDSGEADETGDREQAIEKLSDLSAGHRMHGIPPHHTYHDT